MYKLLGDAIYPTDLLDVINGSAIFVIDFKENKNVTLHIAGENEFQIFSNGKLIGYGPAKAARGYHRVDSYKINNLSDCGNRLVIFVSGYNCNSFDRINQTPFVHYSLYSDDKLIESSSVGSKCYLNESRYQKVSRFSYQRNFSESYNDKYVEFYKYGETVPFEILNLSKVEVCNYLDREVSYPKLETISYSLKEKGTISHNNIKPYEDRYMILENLVIFPRNKWIVSPNDVVSRFDHKLSNKIDNSITKDEYLTFDNENSLTGFISLSINVLKRSVIYVYFDEMRDLENKNQIEFHFYRNTTQNIVSYELKPGKYNLLSFAPYTAKYIKIALTEGEAEVDSLGMITLENPDVSFKYSYSNKKINKILDAAINTFKQNALDILTDCPSRERAGWLCDSYFSSRSEILLTGKNKVERNFLENYALFEKEDKLPNGMIPMCYPSDSMNGDYIPNWSMFYVVELYQYYLRSGDSSLIEKSKLNINNLVRFFEKYKNEIGLLENLESWVFVEWSEANSQESIKGVNLPSNMLYAEFLICAGKLLEKEELILEGNSIKKTILKIGFNGKFFVDNLIRDEKGNLIHNNRICETTQYYALYFDVISKSQNEEFFNTIVNCFGPNRDYEKTYPNVFKSNVFIGDYLRLEILLRYNLTEKVLDESIDYFYKMSEMTGTLWEHDSPFASLNHGFASYIANLIIYSTSGISKIDYLNNCVYITKDFLPKYDFEILIPINDEFITVKSLNGKLSFSSTNIKVIAC